VITIDTSLGLNGMVLFSNDPTATYQWVDCWNNYAPIPNETNPFLGITGTGSYAVVLTKGPCTDTSSCRTFLFTGITDPRADLTSRIAISGNQLRVRTTGLGSGEFRLYDLTGRLSATTEVQPGTAEASLNVNSYGIHILTWIPFQGAAVSTKVIIPFPSQP
jgi:hypothetical protein